MACATCATHRETNKSRRIGRDVKKQLGKQKYGKDIVRVGDFILSSRSLDQWDNSEGGLPFRCPWIVLANAVQVKRSLNKLSKETRVFLELLLLSVVADSFASTLRNLMTKEGTAELLTQLWKLPSSSSSSSMSQAFAEWLSDFEFSTVVTVFDDYEQIEHVLRVMIQVINFVSALTAYFINQISFSLPAFHSEQS